MCKLLMPPLTEPVPIEHVKRKRSGLSTPAVAPDPLHNRLLAFIGALDNEEWRSRLEPVVMPLGQVLQESGIASTHAYFPTSAIVSLLYLTDNGDCGSIAVIGNEGVVGIPLIMGGSSTPSRAVVQNAGEGFRISAAAFREGFAKSEPIRRTLLLYTQALIAQVAQTAVCNRHHTIPQQLCRWLLLSLDRLHSNEIVVTQELVAQTLGVRREGVTQAALTLQRAGLISYRRGRIIVLDRTQLQARSCECYAAVRKEYERLLPLAGRA
jgi:CRP-like cAMP-binding protein